MDCILNIDGKKTGTIERGVSWRVRDDLII